MDREDHLALIREGLPGAGAVWADFGSGTGAFTLALAGLLGPKAAIYSVDRDAGALAEQRRAFEERFPGLPVRFIEADITDVSGLPVLDGAIAANSLHYVRDLPSLATRILGMLSPAGRLLVVEYDTKAPSPWIPYPLPPERWKGVAAGAGFAGTRLLATRPSRFHRLVYSAMSIKQG